MSTYHWKKPFVIFMVLFSTFIVTLMSGGQSLAYENASQATTLEKAVTQSILALGYTPQYGILVTTLAAQTEFVYGSVAFIVSAEGGPISYLFLAQRVGGNWQVSLEGTQTFYSLLKSNPGQLVSQNERSILISGDGISIEGNGSAQLSLPFGTGETWTLTGGPHGNLTGYERPWSALDLQSQDSGHQGLARAAADGIAHLTCGGRIGNFIRLDHANGWQTGYFHIAASSITVNDGQSVSRGQVLGRISTESAPAGSACHGDASGPHVHFSLRRNGAVQAWDGMDVGGWTAHDGSAAYNGCLTRVRDNYTRCQWHGI